MEFSYKNVISESIEKITSQQMVVECKINELSYDMVKKVLCISATPRIVSYEIFKGELKFVGKINFKLIYLDTEDNVCSLDYLADFDDSIKNDNIMMGDKVFIDCQVLEVNSSANDMVKLSAVVNVDVSKVVSNDMDFLTEVDENNNVKMLDFESMKFVQNAISNFEVSDDYDTGVELDKILMLEADAIVCESMPENDKLKIMGVVNASVTYQAAEVIYTKRFEIPFTQLVEAKCDENCVALTKAEVVNCKVILAGSENDNTIIVKVNVESKSAIFEPNQVSIVDDMYSLTNELDIQTDDLEITKYGMSKCYNEKVVAVATLDDQMNPVKSIIGINSAKNTIANTYTSMEKLVVEGLITACVLYREDDEIINSVEVELPYSVSINIDNFNEDCVYNVSGIVMDLTAKQKLEMEIEVNADLKFVVLPIQKMIVSGITEVEVGDELKDNDYAFTVIISQEGDTWWTIAKKLSTTPDEIRSQNPNLPDELTEGTKIVYYRKKPAMI